jgi:hypothetical protein
MKYLKLIGLAALAVTALMAIGASSASANAKVCSTVTTNPPNTEQPTVACKSGHGVVYSGEIHAVNVGIVKLTATEPDNTTVECTTSTSQGTVNGTTGSGTITTLTFSGCSSGFCSAVGGHIVASAPGGWSATATTEITGTENTNGIMDVTINGNAGKFECIGGFVTTTCEYSATTPTMKIDGSDTEPKLTATNIPLTKTLGPESTCGKKADWTGTYKVTTPSSLFIE